MAPDAAGALGRRISQDLAVLTLSLVKDKCFANARVNASAIAAGKSILTLSDDFSAHTASVLCGREDQLKPSYSLSESGHDTKISWLTGKGLSHKANIIASKSYNTQPDYRFDTKTFMELRNAQSVTVAYDGVNPTPPMFCYLKPYYNDPNESYFKQVAEGAL